MAAVATSLLSGTCYALITSAWRIFKKFELAPGELVRFDDFLRSLPKQQEDDDFDEEEMPESPSSMVI